MPSPGLLVVPIIAQLYTIGFLLDEGQPFLAGWRTRHWPRARAEILHAELRRNPFLVNWIPRAHAVLPDQYPTVIYRYTVGGRQYHGANLGYRGNWPAYGEVLPWKAGDAVDVRYDPQHPSHAVLQAGVGWGNCLGVAVALLTVILAFRWVTSVAGAV